MVARISYGQTWWGAQWLNALTSIDYDNRLPRGRTYANKGAVTEIHIRDGKIRAKVAGSRPRPYDVEIDVPAMPSKKVAALLDTLAQDPVIIAKLLNRELDPAVLERAQSLGITVFPEQWRDLSMDCSCPDWAVPCKHLAAVIYLVSREIDGNPFMVFGLKGVDLPNELKRRNVSIEREAEVALPTIDALLRAATDHTATIEPEPPGASKQNDAGPEDYTALDYSSVPSLGAALASVLPATPPFFQHGDFRAIYEKVLSRVARHARLALNCTREAEAQTIMPGPHDRPRIVLDAMYQPVIKGASHAARWPVMMQSLEQLAEADLPDLQPEIAALYHARMLSLHLLAQGAVLPQVFGTDRGRVAIRWLPAMLEPTVHALIIQLAKLLPPGLVSWRSGSEEMNIESEAQAMTLCSLFLDAYVADWGEFNEEKPFGNKVLQLFFGQGRDRYDGPGEGAVKAGVSVWLSRFHLGRQAHAPVMLLNEGKSGFSLSLAVEARDAPLEKPVPFANLLTDRAWTAARYGVLQTVSLLAEFFPALHDYVRAGAAKPISMTAEALPVFLFDTLPVIRLLGIRTLLPKALDRVLRPRLSMKISGNSAKAGSGMPNADDMFRFDWAVAIGAKQVSPDEFERLVHSASGIVRFKGEYVYLDPHEIERLRAQLDKPQQPTGAALLRIALAQEYAGTPVVLDKKALSIIHELSDIGSMALPAALDARLRPYQERGFAWLYRNMRAGFGSVIADDMGLGKTVQVISAVLKLKEDGHLNEAKALVIVPTSLLTNWVKEIARFAPSLTTAVFHGATQAMPKQFPDVMLTTYGVVRAELPKFSKLPWRVLIADEAQNIKNPAAAQTKAVKAIPAESFIAMSGTPVENRLSEYWSIMDFANRGFLGNLSSFTKEFVVPIQSDHDPLAVQRFKRTIAPFLLRRLKSDKSIISDLPDKIEQDQYCELSPEQAALYESVLRESMQVISGESNTFERQGLVLQMIMALKQICNHPAQYLKRGKSEAALSGKAELFLDLLDPIVANHEKVLVFTQFREAGTLLSGWIKDRFGREPQFLHGGVTRKRRDEMVERFQNDRTERIFLLSLKAGGTGLNLTAASKVIHYDLWWNPAVEAQATDRAYRIGQQRNVQVHRLITRATFEERINDMIQSKRDLANLTVGTGEKWIGNLSNAELKEVFRLG